MKQLEEDLVSVRSLYNSKGFRDFKVTDYSISKINDNGSVRMILTLMKVINIFW